MEKAKEKAIELYNKFKEYQFLSATIKYPSATKEFIKQCAIIAVDLMIDEHTFEDTEYANRRFLYLRDVKTEIQNL